MGGRALLVALLLAGPARAADEAPDPSADLVEAGSVVIEAAHVRWVPATDGGQGRIEGEGGVTAAWGGDRATAERFTLWPETGALVLEAGTWTRPGGSLRFDRAEIDVEAGSGRVEEAVVALGEGRGGEAAGRVEGAALTWTEDGRLVGEAISVTTCTGCARPTWEVRARHAEVIPGEVVRFRGGLVRLCGLPLLPLPGGSVPLAERRSGLLLPRLSYGEQGLTAALPAWLALGPRAELELTPEVRTARGARLLAGGRWVHLDGGGEARVAAGWDGVTGGPRGSVAVDQGLASGPARVAVDARLESDRAYLADYGDAFLSRTTPWAETLAVAGYGPLRLEHLGIQALADDPDAAVGAHGQRPLSVVASAPAVRLGPVAGDGGARVDVHGAGTLPWELAGPWVGDPARSGAVARMATWLGAAAGRDLLPALRVEAEADGGLQTWSDGDPWAEGRVVGRALVPGWLDLRGGRLLSEVGAEASVAGTAGTADLRLPWERAAPAWSVGPVGTTRLLLPGGVPLSGTGGLSWTPDGLLGRASLRADLGAWSLRGDADPRLQDLRLAYDDGLLRAEAGAARLEPALGDVVVDPLLVPADGDDPFLQARSLLDLALPAPATGLRAGYTALADVPGGRLLAHGPRLSWSSPCDCLEVGAAATWSADRVLPDVGLQAELR